MFTQYRLSSQLLALLWKWNTCYMDICCSNAGHHTGIMRNYYTCICIYPTTSVFQINVVFLVLVLRSIFKTKMSKLTKESMGGSKEHKEKEVAK